MQQCLSSKNWKGLSSKGMNSLNKFNGFERPTARCNLPHPTSLSQQQQTAQEESTRFRDQLQNERETAAVQRNVTVWLAARADYNIGCRDFAGTERAYGGGLQPTAVTTKSCKHIDPLGCLRCDHLHVACPRRQTGCQAAEGRSRSIVPTTPTGLSLGVPRVQVAHFLQEKHHEQEAHREEILFYKEQNSGDITSVQ